MVIHVKRAGYLPPWGWQLCRVMGGSFRVKWVAALPYNQWQLCCEIRSNEPEELAGALTVPQSLSVTLTDERTIMLILTDGKKWYRGQ